LDLCVGSLVRAVRLLPGGERTLVCVTADHGEGLHEHDRYFGHDTLLYDTALRVPLLLSGGGVAPGLHSETARTIDVAPTILGWFGVDPGPELEGRDLLHEPAQTGPLFVETHPAEKKAAPAYGVRSETRKVLWQPEGKRWESYDLATDPSESADLGERHDGPFGELTRSLASDLEAHPPTSAGTIDDETGGPTDDVLRALEALGYIDAK
jgi:arylsulfatase A-like enzyme